MKIKLLILLLLASIGATAQSWTSFGTGGIQRRIVGSDTTFRWVGSTAGTYVYGSSEFGYSKKFVQLNPSSPQSGNINLDGSSYIKNGIWSVSTNNGTGITTYENIGSFVGDGYHVFKVNGVQSFSIRQNDIYDQNGNTAIFNTKDAVLGNLNLNTTPTTDATPASILTWDPITKEVKKVGVDVTGGLASVASLATGQTIGANTTGRSDNSLKWNAQDYIGDYSGETLTRFMIGTSTQGEWIGALPTTTRNLLGLGDGSDLNNVASNSIRWNGESFDGNANTNPQTFMAYDGNTFQWRPTTATQTRTALGVLEQDFSGYTPTIDAIVVQQGAIMKPSTLGQVKTALATSLQDARSVDNTILHSGTTNYGLALLGNSGATDILIAGQSGVSNGFRVQFDGTKMMYRFDDGSVYVASNDGASTAVVRNVDIPFENYLASGTGASTTITIPHGLTGITATSKVIVQPLNAASAGVTFATIGSVNIVINYTIAPVLGTNNLNYSILIKK